PANEDGGAAAVMEKATMRMDEISMWWGDGVL
nr:hypothetical protein [Tanacetum cinerariifolium]